NSSFATVRVTNPPQAEVTLGAGTTVANNLVQIREGQTAQVTFRLGSSPQRVTGRVLDQNGNPLAGVIIGGVISGATPPVVLVASAAPTDANGVYTLVTTGATPSADIPEGNYILTASLIGYSSGTATITVGGSGTLTVPDITLTQLQPGSVSGLVTGGARLTTPVAGAVVTLFPYVNGAPIDTGKQSVTTTVVTTVNGYSYNYRFDSVPPGQYVATARFIPAGAGDANNAASLALVGNPNPSAVFTVTENAETRSINFTLTPLQTYPAGLQMISLPNDYSGFTPYQVFGLAPNADNDEDGTPGSANDQSLYNVFAVADWKIDQSGYAFFGQRFPGQPEIRFQPATGYFVRFGDPTPVVLAGQGAPTNTFDKQLPNAGWYILGNPFGSVTLPIIQNVPLDITRDLTFTYQINGVQRSAVRLDQAVVDGAAQRVVFDFSGSQAGSQYRQTTAMLPFQGYWFRAFVPMTLRFTYPGLPSGDLTRATAQSNNGELMAAAVAELMKTNKTRAAAQPRSQGGLTRSFTSKGTSDWRLQIAARQGDFMDTDNSIGVSPNAKDGFDTTSDTVKPPMVGEEQSLYVTIDGSDDKGRAVSGFSDNIRASGTASKTWEFTVQTTSEQEVTLFWPNVNRLPRNLDPVLVDIQTGRRVSLRTGGASYRYQPKGRSAQRFRVEVNAAASRPLALTNVKTNRVQNVGGDGRAVMGSAYRFSFTATQEADVTADIQRMDGRTMRRLQTRAQANRESSFVWDGRDDGGASMPAGTYIISLTAKDANTGSLVRTRIPILTVR
ncbi:MAG: FlgD immunoglobulin-like domain containing protein, partial [Armatimonadota bacterium]